MSICVWGEAQREGAPVGLWGRVFWVICRCNDVYVQATNAAYLIAVADFPADGYVH